MLQCVAVCCSVLQCVVVYIAQKRRGNVWRDGDWRGSEQQETEEAECLQQSFTWPSELKRAREEENEKLNDERGNKKEMMRKRE